MEELSYQAAVYETTATPEQFDAIDRRRRPFHVLTRTVEAPPIGEHIRIRELEVGGPLTGRELYVRVTSWESLAIHGVNHAFIVGFELKIGSGSTRIKAVRTEEDIARASGASTIPETPNAKDERK